MGAARNWRSVTAKLSDRHRTCALDLRNHGNSPHTGPFDMNDLAADVEAWLEVREELRPATVLGHSLGGKVAMKIACRRPDLVSHLIVVDITSEAAPRRWGPTFEIMRSLDVASISSRKDADDYFESKGIEDWAFRRFLTSGLVRDEGIWKWGIGLNSISESSDKLVSQVLEKGQIFEGPTLLIRGADSTFAPESTIPAMREHFPALHVQTIPDAGHNVHIDQPLLFLNAVRAFMAA